MRTLFFSLAFFLLPFGTFAQLPGKQMNLSVVTQSIDDLSYSLKRFVEYRSIENHKLLVEAIKTYTEEERYIEVYLIFLEDEVIESQLEEILKKHKNDPKLLKEALLNWKRSEEDLGYEEVWSELISLKEKAVHIAEIFNEEKDYEDPMLAFEAEMTYEKFLKERGNVNGLFAALDKAEKAN